MILLNRRQQLLILYTHTHTHLNLGKPFFEQKSWQLLLLETLAKINYFIATFLFLQVWFCHTLISIIYQIAANRKETHSSVHMLGISFIPNFF